MNELWILVAGSSAARFYSARHRRAPLELVDSLSHEAARLHPREVGTEQPGRVHDRFGPGRHSLDDGPQIRSEERLRFAREIVARLGEAHRRKAFSKLVLMAGPTFLGVLRETLPKTLAATIVAEVPKDLLAHEEAVIRDHIP